ATVQVAERDVAAAPERHRQKQPEQQQTQAVTERVRASPGQTRLVDGSRGAETRFSPKPGGEQREGNEPGTETPASREVVGLRSDAARQPEAERQLQAEVAEQKPPGHGRPDSTARAGACSLEIVRSRAHPTCAWVARGLRQVDRQLRAEH